MDVLWELKQPSVISEILNADTSLKRNTVTKVLTSLEKKGYIRVDCIRKSVTRTARAYVPTISRKAYEKQNALISALTTNDSMPETALSFVSTMLESETVNDQFVQELEKMIEEYKNKRD